jgi:signal transduction histidine kinase
VSASGRSSGGTWSSGAWRRLRSLRPDPLLVDSVLAVALAAASGVEFLHDAPGEAARLPLVVAAPLPLALRRRFPLPAVAVMIVLTSLAQRPPTVIGFAAIVIAVYSVGAHSGWRLRSLALLALAAVGLQVSVPQAKPPLPSWSLNPLLIVGLWLAGDALRGLHERARRLEREQELVARIAVADERARIARELHDVVAHNVSLMVVQAGAARRLLGGQAGRPGEAMLAVESGGREALNELRRMLGLLTGGESETASDAPPGLDQVEALVERMRGAGLPVELRIDGARRSLPPGLDLAAYRIVQEALTNVLKHAPGARTEVLVRFLERELRLEVVDAGGVDAPEAVGAGRGLAGMRERVAAHGGELDAAPLAEGGFAVRVRLPLAPAPP